MRFKYQQILKSSINFGEVRNNFQRDRLFISEMINYYRTEYSNILPQVLYTVLLLCMLFTHWYYTSVSGETSTVFSRMRNLLFYSMVPICVSVFIWLIKAEVGEVQKRGTEEEDSIIQEILKTIDDSEFDKMVPLTEVCFETNIRKIKHGEYCQQSESYIIEYQKY